LAVTDPAPIGAGAIALALIDRSSRCFGEREVWISLGARAGASGLSPLTLRLAFQAVSSLSHHPTRFGEMATGLGKSPAFCIRQAVVRLMPAID
jgi:hypothetical protein